MLIGLAITVVLSVAVGTLWLSLEKAGAGETDHTVSFIQGRVAVARLERDLRLSSAAGCSFPAACAVLQATPKQVVFLEPGPDGLSSLVEWEIVNGALMRRTGRCPATRPVAFAHSLYTDSKTMLDRIGSGSGLEFVVNGAEVAGPLGDAELSVVDSVTMTLSVGETTGAGPVRISATARVSR